VTASNLDNTWLEALVDVGVIGLALLALFLLAGLVRIAQARSLPSDLQLFALLLVLYGTVVSFVNPTIQSVSAVQVLLGWTMLSVSRSVRTHPGSLADDSPPVDAVRFGPGSRALAARS
jgi:O-antigen ligase